MSDTVRVNWSGGKDSTCAELLHMEAGHHTKVVNYIPMLTEDIPLITKKHHEFILQTGAYFRSHGAEVFFVSGMTYCDFVLHKCAKGPRKGKIYGFPFFVAGMCHFSYHKIKALNKVDVGHYDYMDIAIAFDETDRRGQLNDRKRSILVEQQITEAEARYICKQHGLLSPHYATNSRDGCALCPHARPSERNQWFADYPAAREIVKHLQERVKEEYPEDVPLRYPLRGKQWFIDERQPVQLSFFDGEKCDIIGGHENK